MLKKLFICPYFGDFPEWMDIYKEHIKHLKQFGYDFLITQDENDFRHRVEDALGWTPEIRPNTSLVHNYRTAYGLMYEDKLKDYDFWGITDFDCVYGNPTNFMLDKYLAQIDIWSNHHNYICGPWTLFRNNTRVNHLFTEVPNWEQHMRALDTHAGRWTEVEYSQKVDELHEKGNIYREYTFFQGKDPSDTKNLQFSQGQLFDGQDEIMTFHFNRTKKWPL